MFRVLPVLAGFVALLLASESHPQEPPPAAPVAIEGALPVALRERESFEVALKVSGGKAPFAWRISEGALPEGVVLHSRTGLLHGAARQRGRYRFTVEARDANKTVVTRAFELSIAYKPSAGRRP